MPTKETYNKVIPVIGILDTIPFGKYKGLTLESVYKQDPQYVQWMINNVSNYKIDLNEGMNSSPINIINPYYALFYIMKL